MHATTFGIAVLTAGIAVASAASAHAQSIGYVETLGGSISSAVNYNSAGGANSLSVVQTGVVDVTLAGLGNGIDSDVQVNAVNTNGRGHYCTSVYWTTPNNVDVTARVACFDPQGHPLAADFSLFYQARTSAPPSGAIAFLWANNPTAARYTPSGFYSYNSGGAINKVHRHAVGTYSAYLPTISPQGNPQVTAYNPNAARCAVANWGSYPLGTKIDVACVNAAGAPADSQFNLSYTVQTTEAAGPAATALGAYAFANNATSKNYVPTLKRQFDTLSGGPLTAQRFGGKLAGQYTLTLPNPNDVAFQTILGMVTPVSSNGAYCDQEGVNVLSGEIYMDVICYDPDGRQSDTPYSGTLITTR